MPPMHQPIYGMPAMPMPPMSLPMRHPAYGMQPMLMPQPAQPFVVPNPQENEEIANLKKMVALMGHDLAAYKNIVQLGMYKQPHQQPDGAPPSSGQSLKKTK